MIKIKPKTFIKHKPLLKTVKVQKLFTLISNSMGGANVKTNQNPSDEVFLKKGQGLYAWVTESKFRLMEMNGFLNPDWIKFGQFGAKNKNKTPQT